MAFSPICCPTAISAMLMGPNKAETAVHGCHCPGVMVVRMCKLLARPWVGVRLCPLFLLFNYRCPI